MKKILTLSLLVLLTASVVVAQDIKYPPIQPQFSRPIEATPVVLEDIGTLYYYLFDGFERITEAGIEMIYKASIDWLERQGFIMMLADPEIINPNPDLDVAVKRAMNRARASYSVTTYGYSLIINIKWGSDTWETRIYQFY